MSAADWLIVFWLVAFGGATGSFLNVVVYRLPLGLSIVRPPSHCPKCGAAIRWFDNVPVFGWLVLRGRCRQCREPISPRYPLVEALTAAMFGLLAFVELPYICTADLYWLYPYHLLLLCTLLCAGLIEYDGHRPPWRLFAPAFLVGIAAPLAWPELRPLGPWGEIAGWRGAVDGLIGLVAGTVLGGVAWGCLDSPRRNALLPGLMLTGLFLGFPTVVLIAVFVAVIELPQWIPQRISPRLRIPGGLTLWLGAFGWIVYWGLFASGMSL